jgi:hypothetical protein
MDDRSHQVRVGPIPPEEQSCSHHEQKDQHKHAPIAEQTADRASIVYGVCQAF